MLGKLQVHLRLGNLERECDSQYNLTCLQPFWEKECRESCLTQHLSHPELPPARLQEGAGDKGPEKAQVALSTGMWLQGPSPAPEPAADATPGCVTAPIPQATAGSQQVASDKATEGKQQLNR